MERTAVEKSVWLWRAVCLFVILTLALCVPSLAAEKEKRVLRVAFAEVKGLTEKGPDGQCKGLVVDYLNEISKYTGWEYEYVEVSADELRTMI